MRMHDDTAQRVDPAVLERCLTVLRQAPAGLFTDIDGTISAIAPTPAAAVISDAAREALRRLAQHLAFVGVITGRSADDGSAMLGIPGVTVVGNHGLEWRVGEERWVHPSAAATVAAISTALDEIRAAAAKAGITEGLVFENKRLTASLHYRLAPRPHEVRERLLALARAAAERHGLRVTEGRYVVELRPALVINKGTAMIDLAHHHHLRGVAYFGDDVTDVDAFEAVKTLRDSEGIATISVAVVGAETHPSVTAAADVTVTSVDGCIGLLQALADRLAGQSP
jgi:trehalose 6-phosphate phosphatase